MLKDGNVIRDTTWAIKFVLLSLNHNVCLKAHSRQLPVAHMKDLAINTLATN
jgi:hypothetical protein